MIHFAIGIIVLTIFVGAALAVAIGVICDPGPKDDYDGGAW